MKELMIIVLGLCVAASDAHSEVTKSELIDELAGDGYERVELKTTSKTLRAKAYRDGEMVRLVYDRDTGELIDTRNPHGHDIRGLQAAFVKDTKATYDRQTADVPFGKLVSEHARSLNSDRGNRGNNGNAGGNGGGEGNGNGNGKK